MKQPLRFILLLVIAFLSLTWILLYNFSNLQHKSISYTTLYVPSTGNYPFSTVPLLKLIAAKKKIRVSLNDDSISNQKKMNLIRQESRKINYTNDTNSVVMVTFEKNAAYSNLLALMQLCTDDQYKRFALIQNNFIIFGGYPATKRNKSTELKMIYL